MFPNGNSILRSPSDIKCFQNESVLPEEVFGLKKSVMKNY